MPDVHKLRGVLVRAERSVFRGRHRIDVREHVEARIGDPDSARPTTKGVSLPLPRLPLLRAALEDVERRAIRDGALRPHHYRNAGVEMPESETEPLEVEP